MKIFGTLVLFVVGVSFAGCAPGLAGGWDASGHLGTANAFDLDLTFQDNQNGLAVYATTDSGEKAVPVCRTKLDQGRVSFVIDTAGGNTCSTLSHPLTFKGSMGKDVIVGSIGDAAGENVGIWRAYRKPEN